MRRWGLRDMNSSGVDVWPRARARACTSSTTQSGSPAPIHTFKKRPVREINHVTVIPKAPTDEEYSKLRKSIKGDYFITIIAAIIICFPAFGFLVAAIKTYDVNNSASDFLVALFAVILLVVICGVIIAIIKENFQL